jgi:hypothetical protein
VIDMAGSAIWGAGIGFDLNNPGRAEGGTGEKLPWDATAHDITGFSFNVESPPVFSDAVRQDQDPVDRQATPSRRSCGRARAASGSKTSRATAGA